MTNYKDLPTYQETYETGFKDGYNAAKQKYENGKILAFNTVLKMIRDRMPGAPFCKLNFEPWRTQYGQLIDLENDIIKLISEETKTAGS